MAKNRTPRKTRFMICAAPLENHVGPVTLYQRKIKGTPQNRQDIVSSVHESRQSIPIWEWGSSGSGAA
jgi:hypothetical protein